MKYKIRFDMDNNYNIIELYPNEEYDVNDLDSEEFSEECVYSGSLSDCEAFIRLSEGGYM